MQSFSCWFSVECFFFNFICISSIQFIMFIACCPNKCNMVTTKQCWMSETVFDSWFWLTQTTICSNAWWLRCKFFGCSWEACCSFLRHFRWCRILPFAALDCKVPVYSMFQLVYAGLYSTFVFQKPDPDAIPPIVTPDLHDPVNAHEEVCFFCA